jgi:hypothetical protein
MFADRPYQIYQSAIAICIGLIGFFNPKDILNRFVLFLVETSCFSCLQASIILKEGGKSSNA